jgi:hypothetical protein
VIVETAMDRARWLRRIEREALGRCGKIWPKVYAPPAGPED